jgi:hypothetical protein
MHGLADTLLSGHKSKKNGGPDAKHYFHFAQELEKVFRHGAGWVSMCEVLELLYRECMQDGESKAGGGKNLNGTCGIHIALSTKA